MSVNSQITSSYVDTSEDEEAKRKEAEKEARRAKKGLTREELEANKSIYARNRKVLLDALTDRGLQPAAPPDGAFYIYVDASPLSNDSLSLCKSMLDEIGVAATSGLDFQPINGNRYIRFSFCASESDVAEAARRIRTWRT